MTKVGENKKTDTWRGFFSFFNRFSFFNCFNRFSFLSLFSRVIVFPICSFFRVCYLMNRLSLLSLSLRRWWKG